MAAGQRARGVRDRHAGVDAGDRHVSGYRVFQDGALVREVNAATLTAELGGLAPGVTYTFHIQAFAAAGNVSLDGPATPFRIDGVLPCGRQGAA
jgi:hypothetical protein